MAKRTKAIIATVIGAVVVCLATILMLGKLNIINLGIFADVGPGGNTYTVSANPAQGEAYASPVEKDTSRKKVSAIAKNASYTFLKWTSSSDSCKFVDKSKAATIAQIGGNCTITANFKKTNLTSDRIGYEEICTAQDLEKVRNNLNGKFVQTCDIDLAGTNFEPIGDNPRFDLGRKGVFRGIYDGNGKTISNLKIDDTKPNVGLFRGNAGTIRNVTLKDVNILGGDYYIGALIGSNLAGGIVENSIVTGKIISRVGASHGIESAGPLAGVNEGSIKGSAAKIELNTENPTKGKPSDMLQNAGGIAGSNFGGLIENSYAIGSINGFNSNIGGLVGYSRGGFYWFMVDQGQTETAARIYGSYANVDIVSPMNPENPDYACDIGGLVGQSQESQFFNRSYNAEIKDSFALGNVTGGCKVGGLIGYTSANHEINNVYTQGNTIAGDSEIGGLIGHIDAVAANNKSANISNCLANVQIKGVSGTIGGLIGTDQNNVKISNCKAISTIDVNFVKYKGSSATEPRFIGGFIGSSGGTEIKNSSSGTKITAPEARYVCGFLGAITTGKVFNSYATGTINADAMVCGFTDGWKSYTYKPTLDPTGKSNWHDANTAEYALINSYANVAMKTKSGGSSGFMHSYFPTDVKYMVENCYWNKNKPGAATSSYGEGKTTAEMKTKATFVGWDFDSIWQISQPDGTGFPILKK